MPRPGEPETETEIEMVERHLREGGTHGARPREIVAGLAPGSEMAGTAQRLRTEFEKTLENHRAHRARLRAG